MDELASASFGCDVGFRPEALIFPEARARIRSENEGEKCCGMVGSIQSQDFQNEMTLAMAQLVYLKKEMESDKVIMMLDRKVIKSYIPLLLYSCEATLDNTQNLTN